jgi:hypothetical protein
MDVATPQLRILPILFFGILVPVIPVAEEVVRPELSSVDQRDQDSWQRHGPALLSLTGKSGLYATRGAFNST